MSAQQLWDNGARAKVSVVVFDRFANHMVQCWYQGTACLDDEAACARPILRRVRKTQKRSQAHHGLHSAPVLQLATASAGDSFILGVARPLLPFDGGTQRWRFPGTQAQVSRLRIIIA